MPWVTEPPQSYGLKGRENLDGTSRLRPPKISRGLSGRFFGLPFYPRASAFGLRCPGLLATLRAAKTAGWQSLTRKEKGWAGPC
jgi:hypothetical protein